VYSACSIQGGRLYWEAAHYLYTSLGICKFYENDMKEFKEQATEYTLSIKKSKSNFKKAQIKSSEDASDYARNFYHEDLLIYESFFIILLNNRNNVIGWAKISQGGVNSTTVDSKIVLKYAIESLAANIILVHNHPTGNLKPSQADINVTKKIKNVCAYIDCDLLDHIILTEESYTSLAEESLMKL
jgi:DNA repair protein RadC